jgi:hypothetical protein
VIPMQPLTWVSGSFSAHLLAARLRSEGIDVELRGAVNASYGLTMGAMARIDLYVPEDQLDDARLVMLASEVDAAMAAPQEWAGADQPPTRRWPLWVALGLLLMVGVAPILLYAVEP